MSEVITASGLEKSFRSDGLEVPVLRGVDLQVRQGEFICVFGSSGSGKTTLLSILCGLLTTDAGTCEVLSSDLTAMSTEELARLRLTEIGVVFQDHNLVMEFTAIENIMLPLLARGIDRDAAQSDAMDWLGRLGIGDLEKRLPARMSGGQRQRVGIARALVGDKPLLIADEPTGALDDSRSRDFFGMLAQLVADKGLTIVLGTHDLMAAEFASRSLKLVDGVMVDHA